MKKLALALFVLLLASFVSAQSLFQKTLEEAKARARSENKKIIVDFYSYT